MSLSDSRSLINISKDPVNSVPSGASGVSAVANGNGAPSIRLNRNPSGAIQLNNRNKDTKLAKISLLIVFVFIVCHLLKWIPNLYELLMVRI